MKKLRRATGMARNKVFSRFVLRNPGHPLDNISAHPAPAAAPVTAVRSLVRLASVKPLINMSANAIYGETAMPRFGAVSAS